MGKQQATCPSNLTNLPFARETQSFLLRDVAYNKVIENKPRALEISLSLGFRHWTTFTLRWRQESVETYL
jgi:hypothetical protein